MTHPSRIYLDYAAATPVHPIVLRAMEPYFLERFGNAGSLHSFGQEAIAALDAARETIAASIKADFQEIFFTGSATEANNLVLRGIVNRRPKPRIIISSIEHESILETARDLENNGVDVIYLPVDKTGVVDLKKLEKNLNKDTLLVSVMYANNEIGVIQPIQKIAKIVNDFKKINIKDKINSLFFHTDASQAFQFLNCDTDALGVDFMTLSSHKIYGPKGAGALYVKKPNNLKPAITGGGQEFGIRAGTENIPAIVGFSKAAELLINSDTQANKRITELRDELWRGIKKIVPQAEINGAPLSGSRNGDQLVSLPNILNIYFPNGAAGGLLTKFDLMGLAVSSGSACRARASISSYVIEALGYSKERARSSIRFSLGRPTIKKEIALTLAIIKRTVGAMTRN